MELAEGFGIKLKGVAGLEAYTLSHSYKCKAQLPGESAGRGSDVGSQIGAQPQW